MDAHVWHLLTDPGTNFVRVFAKPTEQGAQPLGRKITSLEEWERLNPPPKYNTYVHLNPTQPVKRLRATAYDTTKWAFLLIDMDPKGDSIPEQHDALLAAQLLQDRLVEEVHPEFAKAAVIYSGRGAQLWVRLTPTIIKPGDETLVETIGNACNRFLSSIADWAPLGYRIDTTGDLARIARLPGSRNQKSGRRAVLIDEGQVAAASLTDKLLSYYHPPDPRATYCHTGLGQANDWRDVEDYLTRKAKDFIWLGAEEGNRHGDCHHTCLTLWELGVSMVSAVEALRMGAEASRPPLPGRDVQAILRQVYKRPQQEEATCSTNCTC